MAFVHVPDCLHHLTSSLCAVKISPNSIDVVWHTLSHLCLPLISDVFAIFGLLNLRHRSPSERSFRVFGNLYWLQAEARFCCLICQKRWLLLVQLDLHDFFLELNFIEILNLLNSRLVDHTKDASSLKPSFKPHHVWINRFLLGTVLRFSACQGNTSKRTNSLRLGLLEIDFYTAHELRSPRLWYLYRLSFVVDCPSVDHLHVALPT